MMNDAEAERERLLSHAPSNTTTGTSAAAAALPGSPAHDGFEADGTTTMPPLLVRISEADGWWALLGGGANDSGIHHSSNSRNRNNNSSSSRGGGCGLLSWLFPRVFVSLSHGSRAARTEAEGSVDPYDYYSPLRLRSDGFAASFRRAFASDEEDEDHWAVLEEDLGEREVHHRLGQRSGRSRSRRRSRRQRQRQRQHDHHHHYHPQHDHSDNDNGEFSRFTEGIPIEIRLQPRRHRPRHTMEVLLHNRRIRIRFGRIPIVPDAEPTPIELEWAYHRERERQQQQRNEARACGSRSSGCNSGGGRPRAEYPYGCATYQSRSATEPAPYPVQPTPQTTAMPC